MKPNNLSQLVQYLSAHSKLEVDMSGPDMVIRGNLGNTVLSAPTGLQPRTFVKRSGNQLVFTKEDNTTKTYLQFQSAKEFSFDGDGFTVQVGTPENPRTIKYFYRD